MVALGFVEGTQFPLRYHQWRWAIGKVQLGNENGRVDSPRGAGAGAAAPKREACYPSTRYDRAAAESPTCTY
ncbi:hypothetical protein J6590_053022 [Homalodisca vitripennis]|nr:hypothetical protein J6590_053022 [Homalodisca vitripennis]